MSARVLCNEIESLLVSARGADEVNKLLNPPPVEVQERKRARRERSLAILRGEG